MPVLKIKSANGEVIFNDGEELSAPAITEFCKTYLNMVGRLVYQISTSKAHDLVICQLKMMDDTFIVDKSIWEYLVSQRNMEQKTSSIIDEGRFKITFGNIFEMICDLPSEDLYAMFIIENGRVLPICYEVYGAIGMFILKTEESLSYTNPEDLMDVLLTTYEGDQLGYTVQKPNNNDNCIIIVDHWATLRYFYKGVSEDDVIRIQKEENDDKSSGPVLSRLRCSKV